MEDSRAFKTRSRSFKASCMISSEHDGFDFPAATVALRSDIEFIFSGLDILGGKILNHVPNAMRKNMVLWRKVVGNLTIIAKSPKFIGYWNLT